MTTSTDLKTFKIAKGTKAQIITAYNNGDIGDTDFAIATDENPLDDKVDLDLENMNPSATSKATIVGWAMPSNTYDNLTLGASGTTYAAPANGYYCADVGLSGTTGWAKMSANNIIVSAIPQTGVSSACIFIPVKAADVMTLTYSTYATFKYFRFVYAK